MLEVDVIDERVSGEELYGDADEEDLARRGQEEEDIMARAKRVWWSYNLLVLQTHGIHLCTHVTAGNDSGCTFNRGGTRPHQD